MAEQSKWTSIHLFGFVLKDIACSMPVNDSLCGVLVKDRNASSNVNFSEFAISRSLPVSR